MSGRQYSLSHDDDLAKLYARVHILETAGPYDAPITSLNTSVGNLGAVSTYNPVWSSSGTSPNIGNGTIKGKYIKVGKLVVAWVSQVNGSSTTYGTGQYGWSLPTTPANTNTVPEMQSGWIGTPTAGIVFAGVTDVTQGVAKGNCWLQVSAAVATYGGFDQLTNVIPAAWVSGGSIRMTFIYESTT